MASKRAISYRWRLFLPLTVVFWLVMFGMFFWQNARIKVIRQEMAFDQLQMVAQRLLTYSNYEYAEKFAVFSSEYYDSNNKYDPVNVQMWDLVADSMIFSVGDVFKRSVLPTDSKGIMEVPRPGGVMDTYLYTVTDSPDGMRRAYIMLPYTKAVATTGSSANTSFWLVFLAVGLVITVLSFITTGYFSKNLRILRDFAYKVSHNSNFQLRDTEHFPHDELGDISRQIVTIYNQRVSEIERREREHKVALNAIEEKNRLKREMTGNINHELKTPVGIIRGYIDTICDNPDMDPATRDRFLQKTRDNVHRLVDLIQDVTAITKLESGGKLVNVAEVDFHDFVFSLANYLEESNMMQGKMTFSMDLPLNCLVLANETLLNSVIMNLVKNAVAYSEGTECHLICTGEDEDFYYFRFYDNGVGVAPEHLPHMFERFYRVNAGRARNAGGTGLGLSIVEVTIESFGGKIEVTNHFPSGLEYNFSLQKYEGFMRRKRAEAEKKKQEEATARQSRPEPPTE